MTRALLIHNKVNASLLYVNIICFPQRAQYCSWYTFFRCLSQERKKRFVMFQNIFMDCVVYVLLVVVNARVCMCVYVIKHGI